jgi:hypothetical protein
VIAIKRTIQSKFYSSGGGGGRVRFGGDAIKCLWNYDDEKGDEENGIYVRTDVRYRSSWSWLC